MAAWEIFISALAIPNTFTGQISKSFSLVHKTIIALVEHTEACLTLITHNKHCTETVTSNNYFESILDRSLA